MVTFYLIDDYIKSRPRIETLYLIFNHRTKSNYYTTAGILHESVLCPTIKYLHLACNPPVTETLLEYIMLTFPHLIEFSMIPELEEQKNNAFTNISYAIWIQFLVYLYKTCSSVQITALYTPDIPNALSGYFDKIKGDKYLTAQYENNHIFIMSCVNLDPGTYSRGQTTEGTSIVTVAVPVGLFIHELLHLKLLRKIGDLLTVLEIASHGVDSYLNCNHLSLTQIIHYTHL
jgi:hypothetical protein